MKWLAYLLVIAVLSMAVHAQDNCQFVFNPAQTDRDEDGRGDDCDECTDIDGDGFGDFGFLTLGKGCPPDNCPTLASADQTDSDGDGIGDVCDSDGDGDGVLDVDDECSGTPVGSVVDATGCRDIDIDNDLDGVCNFDVRFATEWCSGSDRCEGTAAGASFVNDFGCSEVQVDQDRDGVCDPKKEDFGAEVCTGIDNCPTVSNPDQRNTDRDNSGDACDPDDDNDGVNDNIDNCPLLPNEDQRDSDGNGVGDVCEQERVPPSIDKAFINPGVGFIGTVFVVGAYISDASGISLGSPPRATVKRSDGTIVATLVLFDDGHHGDGRQGDGLYSGPWDSSGQSEGIYFVDIFVEDALGNSIEIKNIANVQISVNKCIEVVRNGDPATTIDIVFVGDMFTDLTDFRRQVEVHMGLSPGVDGSRDGILNVEPFLSNAGKFNIYLVNELSDLGCTDRLSNGMALCDRAKINQLALHCPRDRINMLSRRAFRSSGEFGGISRTSIELDSGSSFYIRTSTHEFGHTFGELFDEYVERPNEFHQADISIKNCFSRASLIDQQFCSNNAQWTDLKGNGCGQAGVIDCDPAQSQGQLEINCFEGCSYVGKNIFRPAFNTIMRSYADPWSFSQVNERIICQKIKAMIGSAGGICANYGVT